MARGSSITIVRDAVATFLRAGNIPDLAWVYASPPFDESEIPWDDLIQPGNPTRCFAVVFIDSDSDQVIAWDGEGGRRVCTYQVSLELFFQNVSGDASAAQAVLDEITDGVKQRLRFDPALGTDQTTSQIIQAATEQLDVDRGRPERFGEGNTFGAWTAVRFSVQSYEYSS